MILLRTPSDLFIDMVSPLTVRDTTKAYVVGVFLDRVKNQNIQDNSIVLAYAHACTTGRFEKFQELGDWILWTLTFTPEFHSGNQRIVMDLGRRSYETCWRLLRGEWDVFSELADEFPNIIDDVRFQLTK